LSTLLSLSTNTGQFYLCLFSGRNWQSLCSILLVAGSGIRGGEWADLGCFRDVCEGRLLCRLGRNRGKIGFVLGMLVLITVALVKVLAISGFASASSYNTMLQYNTNQ